MCIHTHTHTHTHTHASSHALCACDETFLFYFSGPILLQNKNLCFDFIYIIFYFENLIYKWIRQFKNQQESSPIFQAMFQWELELYFYRLVLQFCLYLNIGVQGIFEPQKKKKESKQGKPFKLQYVCVYIYIYIYILIVQNLFQIPST